MYPNELEVKKTTERDRSTPYLVLYSYLSTLAVILNTSLYDKTDFPFLSSNTPHSPAYGVFVSQLTRYVRACSIYVGFMFTVRRLVGKLLVQVYAIQHLKSF